LNEIPSLSNEKFKIVRDEFYNITLSRLDTLYNLSRWLIGDEKIAAKIFLKVFKDAVEFCDKTKSETTWEIWLNRIFINRVNDLFSDGSEKISQEELEKIDKKTINFTDEIPSYDSIEHIFQNVPVDNLTIELSKIPFPFKVPLILTEIYNLNYEAIAELVDVPEGTINSRVYRGRKHLFFNLLKSLRKDNTDFEEYSSKTISIKSLCETSALADNEFKSEEEKQNLQFKVTKDETLQKEYYYQKQVKVLIKKYSQKYSTPKKLKADIKRIAKKKFGS
jgi:RNA polymerase sigma-70 factor (ECF subfamily)